MDLRRESLLQTFPSPIFQHRSVQHRAASIDLFNIMLRRGDAFSHLSKA
jgi:hypothetical protein